MTGGHPQGAALTITVEAEYRESAVILSARRARPTRRLVLFVFGVFLGAGASGG